MSKIEELFLDKFINKIINIYMFRFLMVRVVKNKMKEIYYAGRA